MAKTSELKRSLKNVFVMLLVVSFASVSFAQEEPAAVKSGPRRQMATIIFAGLGGAVLGLSTLSFYGRPQDKLSNIAIGFALGVIAGTIFVTYNTAKKPKQYYGDSLESENYLYSTQRQNQLDTFAASNSPSSLTFNFTF